MRAIARLETKPNDFDNGELSPISWARKFDLISDPGACAPGFMLPPASQAKTALKVGSGSISQRSALEERNVVWRSITCRS